MLAPTRACFDARGYDTEVEDDWLMKPSEGSLVVSFGRQYVVLKFGRMNPRRVGFTMLRVPQAGRGGRLHSERMSRTCGRRLANAGCRSFLTASAGDLSCRIALAWASVRECPRRGDGLVDR